MKKRRRNEMKNARWVVVPPNTREDFGLTAIEARHLGVPCIITRDGGLPEAGGRQALICEPGDVAGLAKLLEQAAQMSEAEYAERARANPGRTRDRARADGILRARLSANPSGRAGGRRLMILLAHPFGNANVRAVLSALDQAGLLAKFVTALGWSNASPLVHELPPNLRSQMARRGYELPHYKIKIFPAREIVRLLAQKMRQRWLVEHERGWASIDRVWRELDKFAADSLRESQQTRKHPEPSTRMKIARSDCLKRRASSACAASTICRSRTGKPSSVSCRRRQQRYPEWEPTLGRHARFRRKARAQDA